MATAPNDVERRMADAIPIVLIHGLGRTSASLSRLARRLEASGHPALKVDYKSRRYDLDECAKRITPTLVRYAERVGPDLALVGHSMGGLVARILAARGEVPVRSIVMLAPPNSGSEVADFVYRSRLGRMLLGPALGELRTNGAHAVPRPPCPVGIIAGTRSYLPLTSRLIAGSNDGLVSLDRTRLEGADWIGLSAGHTLLMNHPDTAEAVVTFVRDGRFPDRLR